MTKKLKNASEKINANLIGKNITIISESVFGFPVINKGVVVDSKIEKYERKNTLCIYLKSNGKIKEVAVTSSEELYLYNGLIKLDSTADKAIKAWKSFKPSSDKPYFKFDSNAIKNTVQKTKVKPFLSLTLK